MSTAVVTGWGSVSAAGVGRAALAGRLVAAGAGRVEAQPPGTVAGLFEDPLPARAVHALPGFDVRAQLGRKGTGSYDRATALGVVACGEALSDAGVTVEDAHRARIGIVLGTTLGSFRSTSDFTRETLVQDKPYLVNPMLFPNTVMNCATGQAAIRYGLRGVNSTVASGPLAFLGALKYGMNVIERGFVDAMLVGAVEEFSPHRAWATHLSAAAGIAVGEAASVFVVTRDDGPAWAGPRREARVLAVCSGFGAGDAADRALAGCVRRALARSGVPAGEIGAVYTGDTAPDDRREYDPVCAVLGRKPRRVLVKEWFGECDAATGGLALASFLAGDGGVALFTARSRDGGAAAAIVRGWPGGGTTRG